MPPLRNSAIPNQIKNPRVFSTLFFILALIGGICAVSLRTKSEAQRAKYLSDLPEWSSDTPAADPTSITGYQAGQRVSIVPGHDKRSFDEIALTQEMLAQSGFRIERTDYANTPKGHPVHLASIYPWALAVAASFHRFTGGRPLGQCVEIAAQHLNPGLLLLGLVTAALLTARCFGRLPAALLALGLGVIFPFAATFVPGAPNPLSLHALCLLFSLLALLAGADAARPPAAGAADGQKNRAGSARTFFAASGTAGALALWLDVPAALPFLGGIAASGLCLSLFSRSPSLPWRAWGLAGAGMVLLAYFIDYFPARGDESLRYIHPLYALAWIGTAEVLMQCGGANGQPRQWNRRRLAICGIAALALLQLPIFLLSTRTALYTLDGPDAFKLGPLSNIAAPSAAAWLARDGFSPEAMATLLPLLLLPLALCIFYRMDSSRRVAIGLTLGPVLPCLIVGSGQLSYWSHVDVALLALMVSLTAAPGQPAPRWVELVTAGTFVFSLIPSLSQVIRSGPANAPLSSAEFENYAERDLAHWLRQHSTKKPAILAPPRVTGALCFYGGFSGLGTFDRENQAGTSAAVRIVSASSLEEASTLVASRQLTHIIMPFWDTYLDEYLRLGLGASSGSEQLQASFFALLQRWEPPAWLRAIPYRLPPGPGVDGMVVIFEIVDEQPPAVAAARLGEYFLEMDQPERAREQAKKLTQYPNDWGALAALCMITTATNDLAGQAGAREKLFAAMAKPERRRLAWDRRVSLAIVLAQQKRPDLARPQIEKCLAEIDADKLRSLTTISLYRFKLLCKLYGTEISDPGLQALSRLLLRPDLRARL